MANGISNLGGGAAPFWGDGSDGILSAGATYLAGTDFEKYSGFCIKQFSEIEWDPASPETLTVDQPCRGLIIFVDGNVHIGANATISMAKLGSVLPIEPSVLLDWYGASTQMQKIVDILNDLEGGTGGNGGNGEGITSGVGGTGGTGGVKRKCQGGFGAGGGGAAANAGSIGGEGGSIIYAEVFGCGGASAGNAVQAGDGFNGGGGASSGGAPLKGGDPYGGGGSGAGNGGLAGDGEPAGGFILIIAKGSVTIEGTLDVTGGDGGDSSTAGNADGGGGGGAGGGVVAVFAKGTINSTSATKTLTGGAGGTGYANGTNGGVGTYYEEQI